MSELMYGLTSKELFRRAGDLADQRYPHGCASASKLAAIVREVIEKARAASTPSLNAEIAGMGEGR